MIRRNQRTRPGKSLTVGDVEEVVAEDEEVEEAEAVVEEEDSRSSKSQREPFDIEMHRWPWA